MNEFDPHGYWVWAGVEFIRAISWPVAAVIIAWVVRPLIPTLARGKSIQVKGFGLEATVAVAEQQSSGTENPADKGLVGSETASRIALPQPGVALAALEERLRRDLVEIPEGDRQSVLLRAAAVSQLVGSHEWIYNRIFGSQIAGLRALDERLAVPVTDAQEFFASLPDQYPAGFTFDHWLDFLVSNGLVKREGENLLATDLGHDFLVYLRQARLTENKPL